MIRFDSVTKRYPDGTLAVDDLSFEVGEGELVTLVGPSGCGKTTTMMMVNRLIDPTQGSIHVDGADISGVDPVTLRRRIGYVIQQTGLFPHRTVLDNTATVPLLTGWKKARARERAAELLELVGLDPAVHGARYPEQLSGGQRQRVGVARALAADPPVLLMDEPFGAVDPVVRDRLQKEFLRLQATMHKTVLLVTHDIEEAIRLGDRIAVYGAGRIEQYDTPASVLGAPASPYVAEFVGTDRALKQLAVTGIDRDDLEHPPFARLGEAAAAAAARLRSEGARWAVVLDEDGALHGWVGTEEMAAGPGGAGPGEMGGRVSDHARRMEAWVPVSGTLKAAFSEMLKQDAGWIAVLDGQRFLGVLTPTKLHEALRRTIDSDERGVPRERAEVDSVPTE